MEPDTESCELLHAIARPTVDAEQIRRLTARIRNWDSLLEIAQEHRVLPMLFLHLRDAGTAVPAIPHDRMRAEYERNVFHTLANTAELIAVLKAFEDEQIPAMPFKGVLLGASIYPGPTMRFAGDIDFLIHLRHLLPATEIILKRGYELKTSTRADGMPHGSEGYEYHFERPADGMVLELCWRLDLTPLRFRREIGLEWAWPRRRVAKLAGAEVPNLDPEATLLVLCMHGSKSIHIWSRLVWICDVAQLLASTPDLKWNEIGEEAKWLGLWRALALGVLLANRIAGAEVPQAVLRSFESDATALNLAKHIEENLFAAPGSTPVGRVPYNVQLLDFRDRVRLLCSPSFLQPNERDRAVLRLPKPLHALYYLIRPLRIFWDRSAR
jgi:hypothetical protein